MRKEDMQQQLSKVIYERLIHQLTTIETDIDHFSKSLGQQECLPAQAFGIIFGDCMLLGIIHIHQPLSGDNHALMMEVDKEIRKLAATIAAEEFSMVVLESLKKQIKLLKDHLNAPFLLTSLSVPTPSAGEVGFVVKRARTSEAKEVKNRGNDNPKAEQAKLELAKLIKQKTGKTLESSALNKFYALLSRLHKLLEKKSQPFYEEIHDARLGQIYDGPFKAFKELRDEDPHYFKRTRLALCYSYKTEEATFDKSPVGRLSGSLTRQEQQVLMGILDDDDDQYAVQRQFIEYYDPDDTETAGLRPSASLSSAHRVKSTSSAQPPSAPENRRGYDNPKVQQGKADLAVLIQKKTGQTLESPAIDEFYDLLSRLHKLLEKRSVAFFKVINEDRLKKIYTDSFTALKKLYERDVDEWKSAKPYYSYEQRKAGYRGEGAAGPCPGALGSSKRALTAIFNKKNAHYVIQREFIGSFAPSLIATGSPTNPWPRLIGSTSPQNRSGKESSETPKDSPSSTPSSTL